MTRILTSLTSLSMNCALNTNVHETSHGVIDFVAHYDWSTMWLTVSPEDKATGGRPPEGFHPLLLRHSSYD